MATTNHLGITLISQAQAQKEVTANEAFVVIDALLNTGVIDKDLATPPGSPTEGDVYIVAASATGAWTGREGDIAYYASGAWKFVDPNEGLTLWVNDEDALYTFNGTTWGSAGNIIQNAALLGVNTTADATNKLAVASSAILFTNIADDVQVKVNKAADTDTASFLFQTGFSGRAEIGLAGNDDFSFKVSPDGSTFYTAMIFDKDTGRATVKDSFLSVGTPQSLTIASGEITATRTYIAVDTESASATDDLDSISGGAAGDILIVAAADATHTVILKDGTGNLSLAGDCSLTHTDDRITLQRTASGWVEIARSDNAA